MKPFTWAYYDACLDAALTAGFAFVSFPDVVGTPVSPPEPFALLRHDVDYDPRAALRMALREDRKGVCATYFFQCDSSFYRCEAPSTSAMIREILARGHRLGLHFDARAIPDDASVVERVETAAARLETRFERPVEAVSFHAPTHRPVERLELAGGRINTYGAPLRARVDYVSDSNQDFRGKDLLGMFRAASPRRLQVLIHPFWWRSRPSSIAVKLAALARAHGLSLEAVLTPEQRAVIRASGEAVA